MKCLLHHPLGSCAQRQSLACQPANFGREVLKEAIAVYSSFVHPNRAKSAELSAASLLKIRNLVHLAMQRQQHSMRNCWVSIFCVLHAVYVADCAGASEADTVGVRSDVAELVTPACLNMWSCFTMSASYLS